MGELNLDDLERQLVASIRELTKENRLLSAAVESAEQEVDELRAKVRGLEQENAALRPDAERYRFIRATTKAVRDDNGEGRIEVTPEEFDAVTDAAIDAARKEKGHG